ncbi:dihydrolipoamide acetyltransferase family protein [Rathayibacter soli]|uniref:dihydrolipoamide acetyltransferase family protein n=1 Tax=Rathayibacter soli TaxID=3144168 RepID=UPI0027E41BC0|nr:dihydrolipoamide acetyltransferase family protein [Glaciibacter superstes]
MSVLKEFALPDLGEGLTESEIVSWHVAVGDTVALNQIIAEVETAKALVELPSPFAGVVSQLYAEPGATVQVGAPIVAFEIDDDSAPDGGSSKPSDAASQADAAASVATVPASAAAGRQAVLVGYGPAIETGERPRRRARGGGPVTPTAPATEPVATPAAGPAQQSAERPRSTPPVRALARDLGVDLTLVTGTGERGLITRADVEAFSAASGSAVAAVQQRAIGDRAETALHRGGDRPRETRMTVSGVRKHTAAAMVASAFTAPHVTEFLTVDVTPTMELLDSLKARREFRDARINILTMVAKALCIAVARTPAVNSHWVESASETPAEIVQYGYVNLGIAAATPRGLLVPNISDAEQLTLLELAAALGELTATARAGHTAPAQLTGGTITITNVGVFGVDAGTPILNPGEAAILAMGAVRRQPWEYRGEIALRQVMTLSLSFDHRMVDGEQGSRFLADIGAILAEPGFALTMV